MKKCKVCEQTKPLEEFYKVSKVRSHIGDGHVTLCKSCSNARAKSPEQLERNRIRDKKRAKTLNAFCPKDATVPVNFLKLDKEGDIRNIAKQNTAMPKYWKMTVSIGKQSPIKKLLKSLALNTLRKERHNTPFLMLFELVK